MPSAAQTPARARAHSALGVLRELLQSYSANGVVRSIAVLGNAPLEPNHARAAKIDSTDLVVRCNSFVLDRVGEAPTQGSTVHAVVFNRALIATPYVFDRYRDRLYLMVEPGRLHWEPDTRPSWWPEDLGVIPVPNREITLPLADALGLSTRSEPLWPTTGLLSVWLAMTVFPEAEISIAGLSMIDRPDQTSWKHAWGDSCPVGPEHRIETEGTLLRSWLEHDRVAWLH